MRKSIGIYLLLLSLSFGLNLHDCYALNWQKLHETANSITLAEALKHNQNEPDDINNLYSLAIVYFNLHKDLEAKETFKKIIKIQPDCFEAIWGLAEYQRRNYEYSQAKSTLNDIIETHPDFSPAYITLSYIKYMETDFEKVVELSGTVLNQDKEKVDLITLVRAHCLYAGGKGMIAYNGGPLSKLINGPAVFKHLKLAQKLKPDAVSVYFGFGCYYLLRPKGNLQNLEKAEDYLKKALRLDPQLADGYVRLSQVYTFKGDKELAEIFLKRALQLDPRNILAADIINNDCKFICDPNK